MFKWFNSISPMDDDEELQLALMMIDELNDDVIDLPQQPLPSSEPPTFDSPE